MELHAACHCGALTAALTTSRTLAELAVRVCGCAFCLKHRPRYTTDPEGALAFRVAGAEAMSRYRFGLRLADFLICRSCGVFLGAFEPAEDPSRGRGVLNVETLERAADLIATPTRFTAYDDEDEPTRRARRARGWTPATLHVRDVLRAT